MARLRPTRRLRGLFRAGLVAGCGAEVDAVGDPPQERVELVLLLGRQCCEEIVFGCGDRGVGLAQQLGAGG
jgi:hypothetical protein